MPGRIHRDNAMRQLVSISLVIALGTHVLCWPVHTSAKASPVVSFPGPSPDKSRARIGVPDATSGRAEEEKERPKDVAGLRESYGKLPIRFEANHGQTDNSVKFFSRGHRFGLFLTPAEAVLVLGGESPDKTESGTDQRPAVTGSRVANNGVLRMRLVGANRRPTVTGLEEFPGKSNYFIGNNPKLWRTNVSQFAKVKYEGVYPGVDVVYYGNQQQLEYDFVVSPGGNPKSIRLTYNGASKIRIDEKGDLLLVTRGGEVRQNKPIVYQETDGQRQEITSRYVLSTRNEVSFEIGTYDRTRNLIIDPVISYSTYLGGGSYDNVGDIVVDDSGNAYIVGETWSANFPTRNSLQTFNAGGTTISPYDAFVTKLNPTGTDLVFSTFIGGSDHDSGSDIARDGSGNIYITGWTDSNNFPTAGNPYQANGGGRDIDVFVTKLNATGSALLYSTYLGGRGDDFGQGIALDFEGNIYVTGDAASTNFPTSNPFQSSFGGGLSDTFVTKFNAAGSDLVFSTFLGGSLTDRPSFYGGGIAVDNSNNVYVTGWTNSSNFPTVLPFQSSLAGGTCNSAPCFDAYVAKFTPTGTALVYSTYLGGNNDERAMDIAIDTLGNAYVVGTTLSINFPTTAGSWKPAKVDIFDDSFVTKIDPQGSSLVYSTYLFRGGYGITLNANGDAYVVGVGASVSKLNAAGTALDYFVRFGGRDRFSPGTFADNELCHGIALDPVGSAYVVGETFSPTFPVTPGAFQQFMDLSGSCGGSPCNSGYVVKIDDTVGYSISGRVADPGGNGMGGVLLNLTGSLRVTGATDANGNYSFHNLQPGGSYTVVPVKTGVNFTPTSRSFSNINSDQIADFTGTAPAVRVSGRVLNANSGGVSGVTVTLSGTQSGSVLTDSGGNYNFPNLPAGGTYTVTPSRGSDEFVPSGKTFANVFSDQTTNFTLVYDISGRVTDGNGNGVAAVTITLSGAQSATVQTDANGNYLFSDLPAAGSYTVVPSKSDPILTYVFTPASQTVSSLSANQTINFSSSTIIVNELRPVADAYVQDGTAANTNFGSANTLKVETDSKSNNGKNFDSYLRFDVSGISGNITTVKLRIFAASSTAAGVNTAAYSVASTTWSETAIAWNNKPARNGTPLTGATAIINSINFTTYDLDITAYVRSEKNAGNDLISLALHNPTASTVFVTLNSREAAANRPQLIVTTSPSPNTAPSVSIASPGGPSFTSPANILLSANASDSDGSINMVEFFAGTTRIGTVTTAPYQITWGPVSDGNYSLTAVATDNSSASTVSSPISISVKPPNTLPSVTLDSPPGGTTFPAGSNISLAATATDFDGTITKVEFFAGAALIGTATVPNAGATYNITWTNVNSGGYALTAKATDNANGTRSSSVVNINVVSQSGLSPTADAYVRDGSSANTNFGTVNELQTQVSSTGSNRETYLKFDITTVTGIVNAKLRLNGRLSDTSGTNVPTTVYPVLTTAPDWTESGNGSITWNNKPATGPALTSVTIADNNARWYEWNLTAYIQSEKAAGRNVIKLAVKNTAPSTPYAIFNSKEAANNRPQLILWTTQARNALLVTNSTTLGTGDSAIRTRLQSLGYTVTVKAAGTNNNAIQTTDANGKTLVLISSSVTHNNVLAKFRHVPVPVMTWEWDLYDDHGMTASAGNDFGTATGQTQLVIVNSAHPMAAGLSGSPTVSASSTFSWGKPSGNAIGIATLFGDATRFAIFGYDNMATMADQSLNAPARRVGFFLTDLTANVLTPNGNLLFDAAVRWATELVTSPFIGSLNPSNGLAGTQVSITGLNFGVTQGTSTVSFNGVNATPTFWSDTNILVNVPAFATTGPVLITVNGVASNELIFAVGATDSDGDGLPDSWEVQYFGNLNETANGDPDGDGLTNLQEFQQGRNPTKSAVADDSDFINLKVHTPLMP